MRPRRVVIMAFDGMQSLDAVGPFEVFSGANRVPRPKTSWALSPAYTVILASLTGGPIKAESGLGLATAQLPGPVPKERDERIDTLVIPGGDGVLSARSDPELVSWIKAAAPRCRRVATVCSGAFLAAEAGLLDGRRVTTHWARAERLATEYPALRVDSDPIYLRDGKYWSSAGVTAGIDLALTLVEEDLGTEVAQTVARWLVMFLHRPGGQTQFATSVWAKRAERSAIRQVQNLVESSPGEDHRVPNMAGVASMSVRQFNRVFASEVGEPPGRFVERVRMEVARRELETTNDTLDVIAARCGFGTAETLRRVFKRRLNVAPDSYRRRFKVVDTEVV
jgi:transcriptional regulator GlxA family with amidase domain